MTQQREFRPNKLCNIPTLTIWISRIYLPSPVNSISLCLRKHTCNYHPYTCLDTTFALTKICLLCVKTNYKFSLSFQNHERFQTFKFMYSEKATKFREISILLLTSTKDLLIKNQTTLSSVLLLCLVRFFMNKYLILKLIFENNILSQICRVVWNKHMKQREKYPKFF